MNRRLIRRVSKLRQRGITTLIVAILLLIILSVVVFFATSVGIFDQRTATNENRAQLTQQAAEARLNLGIEYLKANAAYLTSDDEGDPLVATDDGWLLAGSEKWVPCTTAAPANQLDPCLSIRDTARRNLMYRYVSGGSTALPYSAAMPGADVGNVGNFPITGRVAATLCRFDIDDPALPRCSLDPATPGMISVTVVSEADMRNAAGTIDENANAEVQETVGTYRIIGGAASVPLVASGTIDGTGNAQIVPNPNAGGPGVPASIWAPDDVDIANGSMSTCQMGEFLDSVGADIDDLFTVCAGNNQCKCDKTNSLSEKTQGGGFGENIDILDVDGMSEGVLPDITYFPREPLDDPADPLDDSLFEWIFAQDVVAEGAINVSQTCTDSDGGTDCAKAALDSLSPVVLGSCAELNAASSGLYWSKSACDFPNGAIGAPDHPVIVVVENELRVNGNTQIYGMIFVRSSTNSAVLNGNGNIDIFGSAIVEGAVQKTNGSIRYIYSEQVAQNINNSPAFTRFGKVPGSWLDSSTSF